MLNMLHRKRHRLGNTLVRRFTGLWVFLWSAAGVYGQSISIDRGVRAAGLWCFPLSTDSTTWLYLPDRGLLATDEQKRPQFSFIRYVKPAVATADESATTSTAEGGAVLHFLVTYDTDPRKIEKAEQDLNEQMPGPALRIRGPVIFTAGRYALVSSTINGAPGEKQVLSVGAAPVLQGSRIALSFELPAERSKLLLESLKMPTPDISIVFDMTFSGLLDAYDATVTVDWSLVNKSRKIGAGVSLYFISADIEDAYEELRRTGAISVVSKGEDEKMEKLMNEAYARITDMMFQKIDPEKLSDSEQQGILPELGKLLGSDSKFSGGTLYGFGAHAVYKKKNIRTSGASVLQFNSRRSAERHHYFTFNVGNFYKKYGEDEQYIRTVSLQRLDDQVRHITISVDGNLLPEFDKLINYVTVKLRKTHEDGSVTMAEQSITKNKVSNSSLIQLNYDAVKDKDPLRWYTYEYNAQFSFRGGKTWETGWQKQDLAVINLLTPYERRVVRLEADPEQLRARNVRAVTIRVEYPFLGEKKALEQTVLAGDDLSQKQFEITLPTGQYSYAYRLRWQMRDGTSRVKEGESDSGILFIDGVPDN